MKTLLAAALAASAALSTAAQAATFTYAFGTPLVTQESFSFSVDDAAGTVGKDGNLTFDNVAVEGDGAFNITSVTFFDLAGGGGLSASGRYTGPQLYTGTPDDFALLTGAFTVTNADTGFTGVLTVTSDAAGAAVPEPAAWALMLAGFGLVGAGLRARRRSTAVTYA